VIDRRAGQERRDAAEPIPRCSAQALLAEAAATIPRSCAITAAMPSGTGLDKFAKAYPRAQLRRRHCRAARR
jgi:deoxyxylulose-5-phosphate synthase